MVFDLLYLVLDQVDETLDRKLTKHLVGLYLEDVPHARGGSRSSGDGGNGGGEEKRRNAPFQKRPLLLHRLFPFQNPPCHHKDASTINELVRSYAEMRNLGSSDSGSSSSSNKHIKATTCQLESLIGLSEAHARIHFPSEFEVQDVN
ncbi:hypothetical protein D9758_017669 [Tetrapyrgos nigripes]|uniref:MCM AAA-lid domain-containing protein n=1 Tax=Tetrapyrgos nigripes TaxID=182062 RepID=A0A8H5C4Y4_9AGAR|nr:hypothetical protein D9758_017669 [Tetrapyrgos nigripes]